MSLTCEPVELDGCIIRQLRVQYNPTKNSNEPMREYEFTQYHLTNWPDHGVPTSVEPILNIIHLVRQNMFDNNRKANESLSKTNKKSDVLPLSNDYLAVHCSAGCGRTGTIIAVDQVWTLMNENVNI